MAEKFSLGKVGDEGARENNCPARCSAEADDLIEPGSCNQFCPLVPAAATLPFQMCKGIALPITPQIDVSETDVSDRGRAA